MYVCCWVRTMCVQAVVLQFADSPRAWLGHGIIAANVRNGCRLLTMGPRVTAA